MIVSMVVSKLWFERQCIEDVGDPQPEAAPKLRDVAIRNLTQFEIFSERLKKTPRFFVHENAVECR